ncbi:hypothetical protein NIES2107_01480 [Nostoc carneum NIES-2107]|nr:hypothetical protein NIES2107_01480 [Nostoc carneum NIES-2107]
MRTQQCCVLLIFQQHSGFEVQCSCSELEDSCFEVQCSCFLLQRSCFEVQCSCFLLQLSPSELEDSLSEVQHSCLELEHSRFEVQCLSFLLELSPSELKLCTARSHLITNSVNGQKYLQPLRGKESDRSPCDHLPSALLHWQ